MMRRFSGNSDDEMGHSLMSRNYENVILNADSESPIIYGDREEVSSSVNNGNFVILSYNQS